MKNSLALLSERLYASYQTAEEALADAVARHKLAEDDAEAYANKLQVPWLDRAVTASRSSSNPRHPHRFTRLV